MTASIRGYGEFEHVCKSVRLTLKITHKHLTVWTLWHAQMKMLYSAVWWWFTPNSEKQSAFPIRWRTTLIFSFIRRLHRRRAKFPAVWVSSKHGRRTGLAAKGGRKWVYVLCLSATFNLSVCSLVISERKLTNVWTDASERQFFVHNETQNCCFATIRKTFDACLSKSRDMTHWLGFTPVILLPRTWIPFTVSAKTLKSTPTVSKR